MAGNILRLRGLPFSASEEDVKEFFAGFDVQAVYLGNKSGKNTGEAYVELKSTADAKRALLEKHHQHMGTRYIEIFVAAEADLVAQTSGGGGDASRPSLQGHVVRLRGLPFTSIAQDVLQFFEGVETVGGEAGVVFTCTPDGRPTGEAYVALPDAEALAKAVARHKDKIGSRYIEIFESSKGDMYQAVQQHGFFTTVGSKRRHHWHQQHGSMPAGGQYAPDAGGGGGGGGGSMRGRGTQMDEMTNAFAGFGVSQRDMQVPGPPRWGAYGAPADQQYQQYMGAQPRQMQQPGVMPAGGMRWRPAAPMVMPPNAAMQRPGGMHFNPAPGPPPGKGGRGQVANGRQPGSGGGYGMHEYGRQAVMYHPFMYQHPLMIQQQQQHASMMQQQGGAWYGGMHAAQMGRPGMQMPSPYTYGYYMRPGPGAAMGQGQGHYQGQQHNSRQQAAGSGAGGGSSHGGMPATSAGRQHAPDPRPRPVQSPVGDADGGSSSGSVDDEALAAASLGNAQPPTASPAPQAAQQTAQ